MRHSLMPMKNLLDCCKVTHLNPLIINSRFYLASEAGLRQRKRSAVNETPVMQATPRNRLKTDTPAKCELLGHEGHIFIWMIPHPHHLLYERASDPSFACKINFMRLHVQTIYIIIRKHTNLYFMFIFY